MDGKKARVLLTVTEVGMLIYWGFAFLVVLQLIDVDPEFMYSNYDDPVIVSWNWSFLPLDVLFAVSGLISRFATVKVEYRTMLSIFSLSLMFCAGLMAISFWLIEGFYDPLWWGLNIWLMILPISIVVLRLHRSRTVRVVD